MESIDSKKKKILIFSLAYEPFLGGAEIAIREITKRIGSDFTFDMITSRFDSNLPRCEKIGNITVHRVGFSQTNPTPEDLVRFPLYLTKVFYAPVAFLKAWMLHRKNHYDMLWAMMAYAGFPVVPFRFFHSRIPYVLTLQEGDSVEYMTKRWRIRAVSFFFRKIFKEASRVQVISNYLGHYAKVMGFEGVPEVVPNGVDLKNFNREISDLEKRSLRNRLGIREGEKIIITTSRLVKKNAIDDVVRSLGYVSSDIKFLILGEGPDELSLKKLAKNLGVEKRVIFLGHIVYDNLPLYYKTADMFIRPSLSEGMGSSFVEAMAAGIPAVGTAVGGIVDFLKNQETGFVVEVRSPESIARQVKFILDPQNKSLVESVVKNARNLVEKKYDWDIVATAMRDILMK